MSLRRVLLALTLLVALPRMAPAQAKGRQALSASDIDDIAKLVMLEDRREFDSAGLAHLLAAPHPEVRRRAAQAVGRIADKHGVALLKAAATGTDTAFVATVVWAMGQLKDTTTAPWFDSVLSSARSAPTVATEAATALGKLKTRTAREVLARYLTATSANVRNTPIIAEALFSIGRATPRDDIAPIVRWTKSSNDELRWRATWALYRPRDPAAVPVMLALVSDRSPAVRNWAVRGLTRPQADSAKIGLQAEAALLAAAAHDVDRTVRTEAVRALATYSSTQAVAALLAALESTDTWISVSAAEGLGRVKAATSVPNLIAATSNRRPCALRVVAMQSLQMFSPGDALTAAFAIAHDSVSYCRATAMAALMRATTGATAPVSGSPERARLDAMLDTLRTTRRLELASQDAATRLVALRVMNTWADSSDIPVLEGVERRAQFDSSAATALIAAIKRRQSGAPGGGRGQSRPAAAPLTRTLADYRAIVERWVVPDYLGKPRPVSRWETPGGTFDLELFPGDAPLATEDFVRTMESGIMVGTEFTRVVPDFVDQQQSIRNGNTLRDEVNRRGLTRANLAWATAGLDTGTPGYTLGHTPQPHNEGDFTSLGRVIHGMDVVDRIALGDRIVSARMLGVSPGH